MILRLATANENRRVSKRRPSAATKELTGRDAETLSSLPWGSASFQRPVRV